MIKKYGLFTLSSWLVAIVAAIFFFISGRFETDKEIDAALAVLFFASVCTTMINSPKHDEMGQVFQIKKDYKLLSFIKYDIESWQNLPVVFVIIAFNYMLAIIMMILVLLFRMANWYPLINIIVGLIVLVFLLVILELIIDKFKK